VVTSILAIVTAFVGLAVIIAGVWGGVVLMAQKAGTPVPMRYYAIVIGTIGIGVGLLGIAQALRILLLVLAKDCSALKRWGAAHPKIPALKSNFSTGPVALFTGVLPIYVQIAAIDRG
jgi:hypothetical protein